MSDQLRVIQVIPSLLKGGAERLVLDICHELKSMGHEVLLINFRPDSAYDFMLEGINREVIPSRVVPSITGKWDVDVEHLNERIREFAPDVIHSHLFESEIVLSKVDLNNTITVAHFHDNMPQLSKSFPISKQIIARRYERRHMLSCYKTRNTKFVTISDDTYNFARNNLPVQHKVIKLLNAVNLDRFDAPFASHEEFRMVMIGSLVEKKGQQLAIEVALELKNRGIDCHLDLLGDGPLRNDLEAFVQKNDLSTFVHFHGNVDHPEDYLKLASIYLHTAKYEPFGLVIIEAMAASLPVVCTDGIGNRVLIENEKNGFLVPERSAKQIADHVERLKSDEFERRTIALSGKSFSRKFDISNYTERLLNIYLS